MEGVSGLMFLMGIMLVFGICFGFSNIAGWEARYSHDYDGLLSAQQLWKPRSRCCTTPWHHLRPSDQLPRLRRSWLTATPTCEFQ